MEYKLSEAVINKLLNYLAKRPYIEAASLINDLQTAIPIKGVEKPKKEVKEPKKAPKKE